jgi:hypothetical protein
LHPYWNLLKGNESKQRITKKERKKREKRERGKEERGGFYETKNERKKMNKITQAALAKPKIIQAVVAIN